MLDGMNKSLEELSVVKSVDKLNNSLELILGEKTVKMSGSFGNIEKLQNMTGLGEIELIMKFQSAKFGMADAVSVIHCCIEDKDTRFTRSAIGELVMKSKKYGEYIAVVVGFLSLLMDSGEEESGKLEVQ